MTHGTKYFKTLVSAALLVFLTVACNDSNFKSDPKTRPLVKKKDADAVPSDPSSPAATIEPTVIEPIPVVEKLPNSLEQVFPGAVEKEGKFPFSLGLKNTELSFDLVENTSSIEVNRSQLNRAQASKSAVQGTSGTPANEPFTQIGKKGLVDILIVIDDSGSMKDEQVGIGTKLDELLSALTGVDWQIGIITTSIPKNADGSYNFNACSMKLIKSTDADAKTKFNAGINAGLGGDGNEQGIAAAIAGLKCASPQLVRPNSTVATLIISDEDNCSTQGTACGGNDAAKLINTVEGTLGRTIGVNAGFFGLYTLPGVVCGTDNHEGFTYDTLMKFKNSSGKNFGSICDTSKYSSILTNISDSIALLLTDSFSLADQPDAGTLKLKIGADEISANDFTVSGKTVTFKAGKVPANGTKFNATYVVGAKAFLANDTVTVDSIPAAETVSVQITEKGKAVRIMAATEYTVSNKDIKFKVKPSDLAKIEIDYRVKQDLLTRFAPQAGTVPKVETLKVTVGGAATSAFTYDAAKNEVVLVSAPLDGATVVLKYTYATSNKLTYALPVISGAKDIKIKDGASDITYSQNGNQFTIGAADFKAGKKLILAYDIPDGSDRSFELPNDPIDGTETLDSNGSCKLGNGIVLASSKLSANCAVEEKTDFVLTYKYLEIQKIYAIEGIPDPEKGSWVVTVDGEATSNYVRSGNTVTLSFDPGLDSKVGIRYTFPE